MAEYLELEKVLDDRNIITVKTKEYGSIEVIPVDTITDIELADVQPVKRGKMIAMSDDEKYRAYKETARDYDGRCSLCNCCVYDTDIYCAECGAILQDTETIKG